MKVPMKIVVLALVATLPLFAQIQTADQFFEKVSATYAAISDYQANLNISTAGGITMTGTVLYKAPNKMRVDFSQPPTQTIIYDGKKLLVYIPETATILNQDVTSGTGVAVVGSREGLRVMRSRYSVSYLKGPSPEPMEAGSSQMAVKLRLTRRTVAEGFREIHLMIDPESLLIRRVVGYAVSGQVITFDFTGIKLNVGIGDVRFEYTAPSANVFDNFLYGD